MKILVTGAAGFIGFHVVRYFLDRGCSVVGIDNINDYYDPQLKYDRLRECGIEAEIPLVFGKEYCSTVWKGYRFYRINLEDKDRVLLAFKEELFDVVIHLGAQAGVRYSIENPWAYVESNIVGTMSILEACRQFPVKQLYYASSSSVYGNSPDAPFSTDQPVDHPISLYAATKKSNELMAFTYSHLYKIPTIGLRFFTVYGPWGRPDMAYFSFTQKILAGETIQVFNHGDLWRDFTYIDDIVQGIGSMVMNEQHYQPITNEAPYGLYNIGNASPVKLTDFIEILEGLLGKKAKIELVSMQPGDVLQTHADVTPLERDFGYKTGISLNDGLKHFINWYLEYYG
jgi:UDP-glucuronate 4-epimerase